MKWLSAGLIFVNLSAVCGLLLGMAGNGLNGLSALLSLVSGAAFALATYLGTSDPGKSSRSADLLPADTQSQGEALDGQSAESEQQQRISSAFWRYRHVWFWVLAICFTVFAVRSFCWL